MSQFDGFIKELKKGNCITIKPRGSSMKGKIDSGDLVMIEPIDEETLLCVGDIVLAKVSGKVYLHLVKAIRKNKKSTQFQIGNNRGHINGWTNRKSVYGIVVSINGITT
jgi:SOS-response transcriptional repressor LexA